MDENNNFNTYMPICKSLLETRHYAYMLGLSHSLVYKVMRGERKDKHGIVNFIRTLDSEIELIRNQNLQKREDARNPVALLVNTPK